MEDNLDIYYDNIDVSPTLVRIGKNVKYIRAKLVRDTLAEFSERTGISRDAICRLEGMGKDNKRDKLKESKPSPNILTLVKLSDSLGITMSELVDSDITDNTVIQKKIMRFAMKRASL